MSIFIKRSKGTTVMEGKLVGVHVSSQVNSYLSLFVLAHRMTKSIVLRDLIDEWYRENRISCTEDSLIEKVTTDAVNSWSARKTQSNADFQEYLSELENELGKKGIASYYVELILKKVKNEENKKSSISE